MFCVQTEPSYFSFHVHSLVVIKTSLIHRIVLGHVLMLPNLQFHTQQPQETQAGCVFWQ